MEPIAPVVCVALLGAFMFLTFYGWLGRMTAALFYVAISAVFLVSFSESMGKPKPMWSEIHDVNKSTIISAYSVYGGHIFLWLLKEGWPGPIAYVMPWSMQADQELQDAMREAQLNDTHVLLERRPTGPEGYAEPNTFEFHAAPQKSMPDKNYSQ